MIERPEPIFIVGVSQRAGTHFLYDLLTRHPDCAPALWAADETQGSWEDYLLDRAEPLVRYRAELASIWSATGLPGEVLGDRLLASLGGGITAFLREGPGRDGVPVAGRPVTKTPAAGNLDLFPVLFPHAGLVIIVRDPHAVVASGVATFGGMPERWARIWRAGARSVLDFRSAHPGRSVLVRYEDLLADLEGALRPVLDALSLDAGRFDFAAAASLPARGSSTVAAQGVAWLPVPADDIGDPLARGDGLPPRVTHRIAWLAGPEMRALGYAQRVNRSPGASGALGQRARDARWAVGRAAHRLAGRSGR